MIERLDELTAPIEVGRYYMVPTVEAEWNGHLWAWPVIGVAHNDAQCLDFHTLHYHLDARFLPKRREDDDYFWSGAFSSPMQSHYGVVKFAGREWTVGQLNPGGFPEPIWRKRMCRRLHNPFIAEMIGKASKNKNWTCHFDMWTGKQARHDGRGWICPHRSVPLADHPAVDGVITCPLHLLRIDAETGVVLPQKGGAA